MAKVRPSTFGNPLTRSVERFSLSGRSPTLDPRIDAFRADLADAALADRLFTPHYARSIERIAGVTVAMRARPDENAPAVSELALGESFALLDVGGDWAWGYSAHDHYVGYLPVNALTQPAVNAPTHLVRVPAALVFTAPDIRAPVTTRLPLGSRIAIGARVNDFFAAAGGFIHARHLGAIADPLPDATSSCETLVGTPYRWGGRGGDGIDCSGLVQRCLGLAGIAAPRDSDQQRALGVAIPEEEPLRRGDLVFWPGHVGMMADSTNVVHANAFWMAVTIEPLADVSARAGVAPAERRRIG